MNSKQANTHKFVVRFPVQVRDRIATAAKHQHRSMNSEIVARLEQSFSANPYALQEESPGTTLQNSGEITGSRTMAPVPGDQPRTLTTEEESMLLAFRQLPPEKQVALLSLLA